MTDVHATDESPVNADAYIRDIVPGLLLASSVAIAGVGRASIAARILPIPAMVLALFVGIALHGFAARPLYQPGIAFCVRTVLRFGVALLGLRTGIGDIVALGSTTVGLVITAMIVTIGTGLLCARLLGQRPAFDVLVGIGTAVCGASAALVPATVLPDYEGKKADVIFVVVALNTLATAPMVLYPPLCAFLGFDERATGIMLGATIHDVAQVVGSAYPVSETAGNTAVIVKLFRVFLLFPIVVTAGWWFARANTLPNTAKIPIPIFALAFVALAFINSLVPFFAPSVPAYLVLKPPQWRSQTWLCWLRLRRSDSAPPSPRSQLLDGGTSQPCP